MPLNQQLALLAPLADNTVRHDVVHLVLQVSCLLQRRDGVLVCHHLPVISLGSGTVRPRGALADPTPRTAAIRGRGDVGVIVKVLHVQLLQRVGSPFLGRIVGSGEILAFQWVRGTALEVDVELLVCLSLYLGYLLHQGLNHLVDALAVGVGSGVVHRVKLSIDDVPLWRQLERRLGEHEVLAVCSEVAVLHDGRGTLALYHEIDSTLSCRVRPVAELYDGVVSLWIVRFLVAVVHRDVNILILCLVRQCRDSSFPNTRGAPPPIFVGDILVYTLVNVERLADNLIIGGKIVHRRCGAIVRVQIASEGVCLARLVTALVKHGPVSVQPFHIVYLPSGRAEKIVAANIADLPYLKLCKESLHSHKKLVNLQTAALSAVIGGTLYQLEATAK